MCLPFYKLTCALKSDQPTWSTIISYYVDYANILFAASLVIGPWGESVMNITAVATMDQGNRAD